MAAIAVSVRRVRRLSRVQRRATAISACSRGGAAASADVAEWVSEIRSAEPREAAVALLNEELSDVAAEVDVGAETPRAAARIALFSGVALALVEVARYIGGGTSLIEVGCTLAGGVAPFAICLELGRRAKRVGTEVRTEWNAISGRLLASRGQSMA
jgi:hypothetical protein